MSSRANRPVRMISSPSLCSIISAVCRRAGADSPPPGRRSRLHRCRKQRGGSGCAPAHKHKHTRTHTADSASVWLELHFTPLSRCKQCRFSRVQRCSSTCMRQSSGLPAYRMLLFQSLLLALPARPSNSVGVNHCWLCLTQRPLPPEHNTALSPRVTTGTVLESSDFDSLVFHAEKKAKQPNSDRSGLFYVSHMR